MSSYKILNKVNSPADLRYLPEDQLAALCDELRQFLVEHVSRTGGHLASNLGVVELTVALHRVFRSPVDQLVWDVGHQCYAHKILTGRREVFATLRQEGGLSGFPKSRESVHDAFLAGHASTSLAAAEGIARAKRLQGEPGHAIAIVGDGSLTGGMVYEGLNNAALEGNNLIVILNDNKMAIGKNVGSLSGYLNKLRTNQSYFRLKDITKSALRAIPFVGEDMVDAVSNSKHQLKKVLYGSSSFFEELGLVHMGPVDGHNLPMLISVMERARALDKPVFIHVTTTKGKGYKLAEQNPGEYHGVSRFNPRDGRENSWNNKSYSEVFGKYLTGLAKRDSRICAVTAAMKYGTGLNFFSRQFRGSGRFIDVGIAEQHAVTFCAGLAAKNMIPVFAVYSSFLQRAYDQILHDCALESRHVVLAIDRAGLVGEDGETHHGLYDCAFLSTVPGMVIYAPSTYSELRDCMRSALYKQEGVCAVRYPRGAQPVLPAGYASSRKEFRHWPSADKSILFVTYGRQWAEVCHTVETLRSEGIHAGILKLTKVFPIPMEAIDTAMEYTQVLFVEEGIRTGGIGEQFITRLALRAYKGHCAIRAVENGIVPQASVNGQLKMTGLDRDSLRELAMSMLSERIIPG